MGESDEQKATPQVSPDKPAPSESRENSEPREDGVDRQEERERGNESF